MSERRCPICGKPDNLIDGGMVRIGNERVSQVDRHGYSHLHDAQHAPGDLALAAMAYAYQSVAQQMDVVNFPKCGEGNPPNDWPFRANEWHPEDDPVDNLAKAGALIAAEIDRILMSREG